MIESGATVYMWREVPLGAVYLVVYLSKNGRNRPGGVVMTNVGKWTAWYQGLEEPWPYGETTSYEIGAAWLADCARTEDWGCGAGWLSTLIRQTDTGALMGLPRRVAPRWSTSSSTVALSPGFLHAPHP